MFCEVHHKLGPYLICYATAQTRSVSAHFRYDPAVVRASVGSPLAVPVALAALLTGWVAPALADAQTAHNVLVVVNGANADSVKIGEYYTKKRQIPSDQLLRLTDLPADPPDGIDRPVFDRAISGPVARWLARRQAQDRILFIVLTKGIPVRINSGKEGDAASVDSELSVLYLRLTGVNTPTAGPMPNPYFLGDRALSEARPFTRETQQLYLVTRLDGFTVADVIGLVDRAMAPSRDGLFVLDGKRSLTDKGNLWLRTAAARLKSAGLSDDRVVFNQSTTVVTDEVDVLGYYSWGSNDPAIRRRRFNLTFRPGAIGGMFVSTDGRTFREPPPDWTLPAWENPKAWFAGTPQSLVGDLIREGITGVAGHVAEPLLGNTIRPDVLFPAYVSGFSLAEAYYLAMPSVSWMTVVVGDPLCAPFARETTKIDDVPIDPATELPAFFSRRRLAAIPASNVPGEAQQLVLRAEGRRVRGDDAGARSDLERATELAPTLVNAQLLLASMYEAAQEHEAAIARYRTILARSPDTAVALNNLAYALATRKGDLREALTMAERAHTLVPRSGVIADTLGWVHFMSGNAGRALPLLVEATRLEPNVAEIRAHLAQTYAASGNTAAAKEQALKAVELDQGMRNRAELKALLSPP
jgi:uncharacterized protein (TIGR03790 family)